MFDVGGSESFVPSEGEGGMSEQASEAAKQRFAGTSAALQQIQHEEKKSRRRDDSVAQTILQFLTDAQRTHLATLISRLVALNCPSHFILAVLSLISPNCKARSAVSSSAVQSRCSASLKRSSRNKSLPPTQAVVIAKLDWA